MTKRVMKRKLNVKRVALFAGACILFVVIVSSLFSLFFKGEKMPEKFATSQYTLHEIGKPGYTQKIKKNYLIALHYPKISKSAIDTDIRKILDDELKLFEEEYSSYKAEKKDERMVLSIDYETTVVSDKYMSVVFYKAVGKENDILNYQVFATRSYNLKTGEVITLDTIFKENSLNKIAALTRSEIRKKISDPNLLATTLFYSGTAAESSNYAFYIFKDDQLRIYFKENQVFAVANQLNYIDIPIQDLSFYLVASFPATVAVEPTATDENSEHYIDPNKPMIAITFDDGPSVNGTQRILDALASNQAKATFFVVGSRVDNHKELIIAIIAGGHEIGNHTYTHQDLSTLTEEEILAEISSTVQKINEYVNTNVYLVRPVNGRYSKLLQDTSPYPLILWSVDTRDWSSRNADAIYEEVMANAKDGAIIICHDLYESTAEAAERFIPDLIAQGYQLVTVSELAEYRGYVLEPGEIYRSFPPKGE